MNLAKLHRGIQTITSLAKNYWKLFEIIVVIYIEETFGKECLLWPDVPPEMKDKLGLPNQDIGLDFITTDFTILGQAKYYTTGQISADAMNRTRICAWQAGEHKNSTKLVFIVSTDVKISESTARLYHYDKVTINTAADIDNFHRTSDKVCYAHHILSKEYIYKTIERAKSLTPSPTAKQLIATIPLRQCQTDALNAIKFDGISRINMACGTGKSKMIMEYLMNPINGYAFLILVPSMLLLEQWLELIQQYIEMFPNKNITAIPVGSDYNHSQKWNSVGHDLDIFVCVYNSYPLISHLIFSKVIVDEAHHIDKKSFKNDAYLSGIKSIPDAIYLSASFPAREIDYKYSLRNAISDNILADYDVIIPYCVGESNSDDTIDDMLIKYFRNRTEFLSILVYFNRISEAENFVKKCSENGITALSLSCEDSMYNRNLKLYKFKSGNVRLIASVNTLGEGLDITNADICCFARTRHSEFSIIQCLGRVLRKHPSKKMAHVILPLGVNGNDLDDVPIIKFLAKIAKYDDIYYKEFAQKKTTRISLVKVSHNTNAITKIDPNISIAFEKIEELILNKSCTAIMDTWLYKYNLLKEYYKTHKNTFPPRDFESNKIKLGVWFDNVKSNQFNLHKSRIALMNSINPNWGERKDFDQIWQNKFDLFEEYYKAANRMPALAQPYKGEDLYDWLQKNKTAYKNDKLTQTRLELLNGVNENWHVDVFDFRWNQMYGQFEAYWKTNSKLPTGGSELQEWIAKNRTSFNEKWLSPTREGLLNRITDKWKLTLKDDRWDTNFNRLADYYGRFGSFPQAKESYDGVNLGSWLSNTRSRHRISKVSDYRINKLDGLHPSWKNNT